jgi:hypothetical protein
VLNSPGLAAVVVPLHYLTRGLRQRLRLVRARHEYGGGLSIKCRNIAGGHFRDVHDEKLWHAQSPAPAHSRLYIKEEGEDIRNDVRANRRARSEVHGQIGGLRKEMHEGFAPSIAALLSR